MVCPACLKEIPDASLFCNICGNSMLPREPQSKKFNPFLWAGFIVVGLFLFVTYFAGSRASNRTVAAAIHTPITLRDEIQNLPATSWRSIPVQPPYSGNLDVTLSVERGNPLDVFLVDSGELQALQRSNDWRVIQGNSEFSATKTTTYHRTARITQGNYFLILRDTSLGIFSERSSDVSVKAILNP